MSHRFCTCTSSARLKTFSNIASPEFRYFSRYESSFCLALLLLGLNVPEFRFCVTCWCGSGVEKCLNACSFLLFAVIRKHQICVKWGGGKLGHSLGCSVSLSETLTASPRCLTGNQSLGTHEDQDYQSLSCFNVLCWWSDGVEVGSACRERERVQTKRGI